MVWKYVFWWDMGRPDQKFPRDKSDLSSILRKNKWLYVSLASRISWEHLYFSFPSAFISENISYNILPSSSVFVLEIETW